MAQIISREGKLRLREVSNKLRTASATLDMERQLGAIDIHDTDPTGNPSKAFGRVFLIEGKFLTFYAFDLNEDTVLSAKRSFQVWAVPETGKNSARSLGGGRQAPSGQRMVYAHLREANHPKQPVTSTNVGHSRYPLLPHCHLLVFLLV